VLQIDGVEPRTLDRVDPRRTLQVAARCGRQSLERQREGHAPEVELEATCAHQVTEYGVDPLLAPESLQDQRRPPAARRVRLETLRAHLLDDAQPLAELRERHEQAIERPLNDELIATSQVGRDTLADSLRVAHRLDDLEVLVRAARLDATLHADEHAWTVDRTCSSGEDERPNDGQF
jgi:hypothetical protein